MDQVEWVQRRVTKTIRGLMHLSQKDRPRELRFSLEKRKVQGDLLAAFQHLGSTYRRDMVGFSTRKLSDGARSNGFKLKKHKFRLDIIRKVPQKNCGCPISRRVQGQSGQDFEQPGLEESFPDHVRISRISKELISTPPRTTILQTFSLLFLATRRKDINCSLLIP